jgi:hypothetical protein
MVCEPGNRGSCSIWWTTSQGGCETKTGWTPLMLAGGVFFARRSIPRRRDPQKAVIERGLMASDSRARLWHSVLPRTAVPAIVFAAAQTLRKPQLRI